MLLCEFVVWVWVCVLRNELNVGDKGNVPPTEAKQEAGILKLENKQIKKELAQHRDKFRSLTDLTTSRTGCRLGWGGVG